MRAAHVARAFARAWTVAYTAGLPVEARDRRREEIASDLWEHRHGAGQDVGDLTWGMSVVARVVRGMSADLLWSSGELGRARKLELMNITVDRRWDRRMGSIGRVAVVALIALNVPIAIGMPLLLAATLPMGAVVVALELRRFQRKGKEVGIMTTTDIARKRRRRAVVLAASVAVFAVGFFVDALPSSDVHDTYWYLFVAPMMIAFVVGVMALLMLAWSYVPRHEDGRASSAV